MIAPSRPWVRRHCRKLMAAIAVPHLAAGGVWLADAVGAVRESANRLNSV